MDFIKQEVDKEYSESQREIRFFRIELDTEKDRGEERRGHILQVESDLNAAKRQLNELEKEESEQIRELRALEDESEKLYQDMKVAEDESKYLEGVQTRLMRQCGNTEDEFTAAKAKGRDLAKRLDTAKLMKRSNEEELSVSNVENADLRRERADTMKMADSREAELNELKLRARDLEKELNDCELKSEEQIRDLQRQKNLYSEQVAKSSNLYDELNHLEGDVNGIKADIEANRSSLQMYEEKKTSAYLLNKDLLSIIDELKRAIEELTVQNKDILRELEIIADQDEHVRVILNRKIKVEQIKQNTEEKLKKYNIGNRTFSTALSPEHSPYKNSVSYSGMKR